MSENFHPTQRQILSKLLFHDRLRFSDLKPQDTESSQFVFHLNKLLDLHLIDKIGDQYVLTANGKNIANTFDSDSHHPTKQAKQSVVFCAFRTSKDKSETLLYTRKKNPFYDHQGYPTGKVMYGEGILKTAERELHEETGLSGTAKLVGIRHFRVYYPTPDELVEDKVMYICKIDGPVGKLTSNDEGEFQWIDTTKVHDFVLNPLPEFQEIFDTIMDFDDTITFSEGNHYPKHF